MLNRLLSLALACILSLGPVSEAFAAQGTGCMPTTGTVSGLTFAQDVNAGIAALISSNSGASAPATDCTAAAIKGQVWLDTSVTPNAFRQYDGTSTWVTIGYLDATNHLFAPPIGGGLSAAASASTVDLGALPDAAVTITGTTTITSFGSSAVVGSIDLLKFNAALTITYNASNIILPNAVDKLTAPNDVALALYFGSGLWQVFDYQTTNVPTKASPTTSDFSLILDAAANNAPKKSTLASIAAISQVTGIDSKTGAFTTGGGITSTGGNVIELALNSAVLQQTPGSPAGTTSPAPGVMMGTGSACHITPVYSGRVKVLFTGGYSNTATGNSVGIRPFFGTGTAPANTSGITGTAIAGQQSFHALGINLIAPFSTGGIITGLTAGIAYWFDLSLSAGAGTSSVSSVNCTAEEF